MKTELTNVDIYVLVRELRYRRLEKITRLQYGYKLKARPGRDLLLLGTMAIPTGYSVPSMPPDNLCNVFRKHLAGARVLSVEQLNFDRVLRIETDRGSVILELFGKGNIILTDSSGKILYALEQREWSARRIFRGETYVPPPPPRLHPGMDCEQFASVFTSKDVVRSLVRAGLPPAYAEELCLRAGIDKNTPTSALGHEHVDALYKSFCELISALDTPQPTVYIKDGDIFDITPVPLSVYSDMESKTLDTFSEALDLLTPHLLTPRQRDQKKKKDIRGRLLAERERIVKEIEELQRLIDQAYAHAQEIITQMQRASAGEAPESVGPFVLKRWSRKEIVFSFTPPA